MNKEQFAKAMTYLGLIYNKEFTSAQVTVWYEYLHDIEEVTFKNAIKEFATKNKFLPQIPEFIEKCKEIENIKRFDVLEFMFKDGYFKRGFIELSPEQEIRNYDKAIMWLKEGIIPSFLKEDIKEYMRMNKRLQIQDQEIKKIEKLN